MADRKKNRKKMSKKDKQEPGPKLFSDFGKTANDLLTKGYSLDQTVAISSQSRDGVILTSKTVKHGNQSTASTGASYNCKNATIDVNIDTKPSISATVDLGEEFLRSTHIKASLRYPDYKSSMLNFKSQQFFRNATLSTSASLNQSPDVMLSATTGTSSIAFGMETKYMAASYQYDAGISVTKPSCDASIILAERGDLLRLAYVHHFGYSMKISAAAEATRRLSQNKNSLAVGVSCIKDDKTKVKATLNNRGKLQALLLHEIRPNSSLNISGEFDLKALDKIPRIGLALALTL